MSEQQYSLQPALILHQRPFSDTSAIIEFFTRDYGRIAVLAKGVKRKSSKWRASLQAFQLLQVSWRGKGELPQLIGVEPSGQAYIFTGEYLFSALYLNELLMRLLHRHDEYGDLFQQYLLTLDAFAKGEALSFCLRKFELRLLRELGYELSLDVVADSGEPVEAQRLYRFLPGLGVYPARGEKGALKGEHLLAIQQQHLRQEEVLKTARWITRLAIDNLLGSKPLRTRALFKAFKQTGSKGLAGDQKADQTN